MKDEKVRSTSIGALSKLKEDGTLEMYMMLRGYANHEDNLINHRTSWFLTLNAFLYATLGLFATTTSESVFTLNQVKIFITLISVVGVVASLTTYISVSAAYSSIKALRDLWVEKYEPEASLLGARSTAILDGSWRHDPEKLLPYIKGGGPYTKNALRGRFASFGLIVTIGLSWCVIPFVSATTLVGTP